MEPAGYLDWLKQQEPEIIFDPAKLHTKEDWIAAGKIVFETEIQFLPAREQPAAVDVPWPVGKNGELFPYRPLNRYIIIFARRACSRAESTHASTAMSSRRRARCHQSAGH